MLHIFCDLKNSWIEAWGSQTTSIKALESQTHHKNNCFLVKAKFKLFFRQTSLHQNVKHLVGSLPSTVVGGKIQGGDSFESQYQNGSNGILTG